MLIPTALTAVDTREHNIEIDNTTGLGNMFAFLKALKLSLPEIAGRPGELLAAALFDIDHLAAVQAAVGEQATNYIVATIASTLYRAMPGGELGEQRASLYRFSGDEFAMLVRHGDCDLVKSQLRAMQQAVADLTWETYPRPITVTASLACYPACASGLGDLLAYTHLFMQRTKDRCRGGLTCPGSAEHQNAHSLSVELHNNATALVESLSNKVLETAELLQETTQLALTDPLTELPNLRAARRVLAQLLEHCRQQQRPLSLLLVDGDRLKEYNQLFGYSAGNEMIRWLGKQLQRCCAPDGFVARWLSGDEFLVILPGQDLSACTAQAEQLRLFIHESSRELRIPITVSIGTASCPEQAHTAQQLIELVEAANKRAKDGGRNRTSD